MELSLFLLLFTCILACQFPKSETAWEITSPDGQITAKIYLEPDSSGIVYEVFHTLNGEHQIVILPSPLGLAREDQGFYSGLAFEDKSGPDAISDEYTMVTGKRLSNKTSANEMTLTFSNRSGSLMKLTFRAYDEGIAFRYAFPEQVNTPHTILREYTGFQLPTEGRQWIQPYDEITEYTPGYEKYYTDGVSLDTSPEFGNGWCFPALFESDKHWVLLSESDLDQHYYGARMESKGAYFEIVQPLAEEAFGQGSSHATSSLPWALPWRFISIARDLDGIVSSNLVHHLASPEVDKDFSWVKPGVASWSWWSDNDSPQDYQKLKKFIDFGSEMGWEYSLIDANWNVMTGGNAEQLAEHARSKNVDLWLWYNSGGPHNVVTEMPRDRMHEKEVRRAEFKKLQEMGVKGIKVDFFQSDKQHIIQQYLGILEDAADHQIMVNFHGCTIPRGWSRTWPNLMTMEAARGMETYIFGKDFPEKAPLHNVHLVYTRNVVGSMDYTPLAFSNSTHPRLTSYGHELALGVVFESGVVHAADAVESYQKLPENILEFMKELPVVWEDTRLLKGHPSEDALVARRHGEFWYLGYINGLEKGKSVEVDFGFLDDGAYEMEMIADADQKTEFSFDSGRVSNKDSKFIKVLPYGGFVLKLKQHNPN